MNKTKVLLINEFKKGYGGIDAVFERHVECIKNMGFEYEVFKYSSKEFSDNIWVKKLGIYVSSVTGRLLASELRRVMESLKPDIIHIHNLFPLLFKSVLKEIRKSNSKIIIHLHNYYPFCLNSYFFTKGSNCTLCAENNNWWRGIISKCCDRSISVSLATALGRIRPKSFYKTVDADMYVAVSEFVKNVYIRYGFNSDKIVVINNPSPVIPTETNYENDYVLYIGSLLEQKGVMSIINAARQLPNIKFKIAGDGKDRELLMKYAVGVNNIEFVGSTYGAEKYRLYNNCRFVIIPSGWWETFCLVAIEANSCGKYVLTTGCGGLSEIIENNKSGEFYNQNNQQEFINKINKLWIELKINRIKDDCVKNALKYSTDKFSFKLTELYKKLLNKN